MPEEKTLRLRLILEVEYNPNGVSEEYLRHKLGYIATAAAGDGLLTGDSEADVEMWISKVEKVVT